MRQDNERVSLKSRISIISNKKLVTKEFDQTTWLLSYLRQPNEDRAFLLLEGLSEMRRECKVVRFEVKSGTDRVKGKIEFTDIDIGALQELSRGCIGFTAELSEAEYQELIALIEAQRQLGDMGLINYVRLTNATNGPSVAASMEFLGSEEALHGSQGSAHHSRIALEHSLGKIPEGEWKRKLLGASHFCTESLVKLFVPGHNSCTWAKAVIQALKLSPTHELQKIAMNPEDVGHTNEAGCCIS